MAYPHVYIDNSKFRFMIIIATVLAIFLFLIFKFVIQDSTVLLGINEEQEIQWITQSKPAFEAKKCFMNGEIKFIETYHYQYADPERIEPIIYWIVAGHDKIPEEILEGYKERLKIRATCNWGMDDNQKQIKIEAESFATEFNIKMAKLVSEEKMTARNFQ